jgi:hypothetical protein
MHLCTISGVRNLSPLLTCFFVILFFRLLTIWVTSCIKVYFLGKPIITRTPDGFSIFDNVSMQDRGIKYPKKPWLRKHPLYIGFHAPNLFQPLTINEAKVFSSCPGVKGLLKRLLGQPGLLTLTQPSLRSPCDLRSFQLRLSTPPFWR